MTLTNNANQLNNANEQQTITLSGAVSVTPSTTLKLNADMTLGSFTLTSITITNVSPGMPVSGTGIPAGTVVVSTSGSTVTLSNAATATGTGVPLTFTGGVTNASSAVVGVTSTTGIAVGMLATGAGIPPNTTVAAVGAPFVTLSNPVNLTGTGVSILFNGSVTPSFRGVAGTPVQVINKVQTLSLTNTATVTASYNGVAATSPLAPTNAVQIVTLGGTVQTPSTTLTPALTFTLTGSTIQNSSEVGVTSTTKLHVGMPISGTGIPAGATISAIGAAGSNTITISSPATATASGTLTFTGGNTANGSTFIDMASVSGLAIGMPVSGLGIPAGAKITNVDQNTLRITISANATATATGVSLSFTGGNTTSGNSFVDMASVSGLVVGMQVKGPGINNPTYISAINGNRLTLTANATATATGVSLTFLPTVVPSYNGQAATGAAATLSFQPGVSPKASDVQAALNLVPTAFGQTLNTNVSVTGEDGGPFTVTFNNQLGGVDVNLIGTGSTGGGTIAASETAAGGKVGHSPTVAEVQAHLNSIPSIAGNTISVAGVNEAQTVVMGGNLTGGWVPSFEGVPPR